MLVLDTNILIRAVLGRKVLLLLLRYAPHVDLAAPDFAFDEARERLPRLLHKRRLDEAVGEAVLTSLSPLLDRLEAELYLPFEAEARARLRDQDDWPILASALALECGLWTEDPDFFGTGVATWDCLRVERYLAAAAPPGDTEHT